MTEAVPQAVPLVGDPTALWLLDRASGLVLLVLFTGVVLCGQLATLRRVPGGLPRFVPVELHRNLSLLAVLVLVLHVTTSVADSYVDISLLDAVVPFRSPYRTVWLGLGALALDLALAVAVTTALRNRLPKGVWRAVHLLGYASWPVAVVHGLGVGSDTRSWLTIGVAYVCIGLVVAGMLARIGGAERLPGAVRPVVYLLAAALPVAIAFWLAAGPLAPDWSRKAGTPGPVSEAK